MSRFLSLILLALAWVVVCVLSSGCTAPAEPLETPGLPQVNGSAYIVSCPPGAEVYVDNEFRGISPVTVTAIPAGSHRIGLRSDGYKSWSQNSTIDSEDETTIVAMLDATDDTLSIPVPTTSAVKAEPQIHTDGYWTYPQGRETTENPVPLIVHTEAFNTGSAGAKIVTVSANFYYQGRMICWNTLYLGSLAAGGHVSRDSLVSCTLPSQLSDTSFELRFENIIVTG